MIAITGLGKSIGENRILDGVSLTIAKGEVAAIIGPSGGGKSTLLRCINGLERFQEGEVAVGDSLKIVGGKISPSKSTLIALRRKVGMVFQQFNLFPHMTVVENVMSGPSHALNRSKADALATAERLLVRVGLKDKLHTRPAQLSGGQQQRVAIARALAVNPSAVLFDEPTSALDPRMAAEVMSVIDDLANDTEFQAAMIIVSHDIPAIRRITDTVHILDRGRLTYSGTAAEAFATGGPATALQD